MVCQSHTCLGNYNFNDIAHYARMRYVEGYDTVQLLQQAKTTKEKEEIALVCLLDVEDDVIVNIQLSCKHKPNCSVTNCRSRLRRLIEEGLSEQ